MFNVYTSMSVNHKENFISRGNLNVSVSGFCERSGHIKFHHGSGIFTFWLPIDSLDSSNSNGTLKRIIFYVFRGPIAKKPMKTKKMAFF